MLADKAEKAILAPHVVGLLEEDADIVLAILETLGPEPLALEGRLLYTDISVHQKFGTIPFPLPSSYTPPYIST